MATDLQKATHGALKQVEVLLASEAPAYQVLPLVKDTIANIEKEAPELLIKEEKKTEKVVGPEATADVKAAAATPTGKHLIEEVEAEAKKVEAEVAKVVGKKAKAAAPAADASK